jgi:hypothetical protein
MRIVNIGRALKGIALALLVPVVSAWAAHVYEVEEICFTAASERSPRDAFALKLDVVLSGPGGRRFTLPAFWDGDRTWRARPVATEPGAWRWTTERRTGDDGLDGRSGSFEALPWGSEDLAANPNRRGFIRVAPGRRTLAYADGPPFFWLSDTWWSALTGICGWGDACFGGVHSETGEPHAVCFNRWNAAMPRPTKTAFWTPMRTTSPNGRT